MTQFPPWLQLLTAFAAPIATITASLVVVFVTQRYARRQWLTAERQAETALDQLRYNLFEKRFAIYEDVKHLLKLLLNEAHKDDFRVFDVAQHFVTIDEAIFFFSSETCAWLQSLQMDCQKFLEARASRSNLAEYDPNEYTARQLRLLDHFKAMPQRFQSELAFRQLTHNPPPGQGKRGLCRVVSLVCAQPLGWLVAAARRAISFRRG